MCKQDQSGADYTQDRVCSQAPGFWGKLLTKDSHTLPGIRPAAAVARAQCASACSPHSAVLGGAGRPSGKGHLDRLLPKVWSTRSGAVPDPHTTLPALVSPHCQEVPKHCIVRVRSAWQSKLGNLLALSPTAQETHSASHSAGSRLWGSRPLPSRRNKAQKLLF